MGVRIFFQYLFQNNFTQCWQIFQNNISHRCRAILQYSCSHNYSSTSHCTLVTGVASGEHICEITLKLLNSRTEGISPYFHALFLVTQSVPRVVENAGFLADPRHITLDMTQHFAGILQPALVPRVRLPGSYHGAEPLVRFS